VAKFAEVSLTADEAVGNLLFTAKGGQVDHGLNGINVVGHDDKLGLGLFNQGSDVVETELEVDGLVSLDSDGLFSLGLESQLLCLLGFRGVLSEHLEELGGLVLVNGVGELSNGWGNLKALHKDGLLSLNADILGPLDKTGEVSLGLDVTTDSEVAGVLGEEGALLVVLGGTGANNSFLSLYSFLYLILNTESDTV